MSQGSALVACVLCADVYKQASAQRDRDQEAISRGSRNDAGEVPRQLPRANDYEAGPDAQSKKRSCC